MIKLFIKKHIAKLTKQDIVSFANQNSVSLTSSEVDIIYNYIKNNYEIILYDPNQTLKDIETKISSPANRKVKDLYLLYREKYKSYL